MPNRRFIGKELDKTRQLDFEPRYYDRDIGRFLAPDPILSSASPYSYAEGNPVMFSDPTGFEYDAAWAAEYEKKAWWRYSIYDSPLGGGIEEDLAFQAELEQIYMATEIRSGIPHYATDDLSSVNVNDCGQSMGYLYSKYEDGELTDAWLEIGGWDVGHVPRQTIDKARYYGAVYASVTDEAMGFKPLKSAESRISAVQAFLHYLVGGGKDLSVPFKQLGAGNVEPTDFEAFKEAASNYDNGVYAFHAEMGFSPKGHGDYDTYLAFGDVRLELDGTLTVDETSVSFEGTITARDNYYDFNAASRGFPWEQLTTVGRNTPGTPYRVTFDGGRSVNWNGGR
ncbi:MAG: lipid II-degrading bacteriocin [Candidatus Zixiibacteriota bacterium]